MALRYERDRGQHLLLVRPHHTLDEHDLGALFAPSRDDDPARIFDLREPFTCRIGYKAMDGIIGKVRLDCGPTAATAIVTASPELFRLAQAIAQSVNRHGPRRVQRVRPFHNVIDANTWLGAEPWDDLEKLRANLKLARSSISRAALASQSAR